MKRKKKNAKIIFFFYFRHDVMLIIVLYVPNFNMVLFTKRGREGIGLLLIRLKLIFSFRYGGEGVVS